ncbi:MAG: endo-1,4-beta-xylanase [Phycisphaerae bacterium]
MINCKRDSEGSGLNKNYSFVTILILSILLSAAPLYAADWEDDANARIEANRKRDANITVVDLGGQPIDNVDVQIHQVKHLFGFGTCLTTSMVTNASHQDFIREHFEWAVCENDMKWSSNENTRDVWTFSNADTIADWCADNDIKLRGHTLVWETNNQTPPWVAGLPCATYPTTSEMLEEVDERISYTVNRYAGQIIQWDINNEMLSGSMFNCLGEAGRAHMFNLANSVDPDCLMMMNEYAGNSFGGYDGWTYRDRANNIISLGGAVEGLGIQAHVGSPFRPDDYYSDVLLPLAEVGLPIMATEFDTDAGTEAQAADDLENLYRICFSHPLVKGVIMWGYDQNCWRGNGIVNSSTWVLNQAGVRYEALLEEWTTVTSDTTDVDGEAFFRGFHGTYEITFTPIEGSPETFTVELEPGTGAENFQFQLEVGPPDETPPSPDPMTWAAGGQPAATGPTSITMTATTATDINPPIEYYFECTTDASASSGWQTNTTYEAQELTPDTLYTFRVQARDSAAAQNETAFSGTASATTDPPDLIPPTPDPMTWASTPTATGPSTITMTASTATDATSGPVEYYFECTNDASASSSWQSSTTYIAQGLTPSTQYTFRVQARDSAPAQNETLFSGTASAITEAPPTDIEMLGSWVSGISHTAESGYSRALILIAHSEDDSAITLNSVTYGGQPMTKIIEEVVGSSYRAYVVAFMLDEDGIAAATSNTFAPTWSTTPDNSGFSSVFLANVDQADPIGASDGNGNASSTPTTITTDPLSTIEGDMVFVAATCGNVSNYTINSDFTKAAEIDMSSSTGASGHKFATGADETPSVTNSSLNRQVIIGFVVNAMESVIPDDPPAAPTGLVATAGNETVSLDWNDNGEADLAGYNVYRSEYTGGGYGQINASLVLDSNYVDNDVVNFEYYYYVVRAVDANDQESGNSNEASAEPIYQTCAEVQAAGDGLVSDLTGDCYVDFNDLQVVTNYWLEDNCAALGDCEGADLEPDGDVDFEDYSDFAVDWMECDNPADGNCPQSWRPTY